MSVVSTEQRDRDGAVARPITPPTPERAADGGRGGVLLTGATGFLGMELLARYLERTERTVYALVRADSPGAAAGRVERALRLMFGPYHPYGERVVAVRGDITVDGLGLGGVRDELAERVGEIVHAAATVSFATALSEARAINVEGTRRVLELADACAERGGLDRFTHVSTAYVAGEHVGCFSEDELDVGQSFRNPYERSKFEAELLLAAWRDRLPVTVVRPSIIVGEQTSGWTCSFNVLYWPLRSYARGTFVAVPARAQAPVDVVPVDYVADAILALGGTLEAEGATFHLSAGQRASTVGELVALASTVLGRRPLPLVDPTLYRRLAHPVIVRAARDPRMRRALRRSELFFPYLAAKVRFDDRCARAALHSSSIEPPPLRDYFERLVEFAIAADWGRRQLPRPGMTVPLSRVRRRRRGEIGRRLVLA
jgi:long-chain acyl-CoA synthetase